MFYNPENYECCDECGEGRGTVEVSLPSETLVLCLDCVDDVKQRLDICDACGDGLCDACAKQAFVEEHCDYCGWATCDGSCIEECDEDDSEEE